MTTHTPERMKEMPDLPREFGDDGGHFYRHYDKLAEETDEELVKNLKAQLDGILIFGGLFAGVNSTFLVYTLPQLSANPADDTNALLLQIALGVNSSITSTADLPSASFLPSHRIYLVNVLFSVSLMLALFSSLLAVFGQQWIVDYRKRGSGGAEDRRWEQLRRYLGAKQWRLELILDDVVPSLLQIGLVIFCIAFALHVGTLSKPLGHIIVWLLYIAAATILAMAISMRETFPGGAPELLRCVITDFNDNYRVLMSNGIRSAKDPDDLKMEALRRVMCTSEDRNALIYAAMNLQVLRNECALLSLAKDAEFYGRLYRLMVSAMSETQGEKSSNRYSLTGSKLISTTYFHFIITVSPDPYICVVDSKLQIQVSGNVLANSGELNHVLEESVLTPNPSRDQRSHCPTLIFSMRVAYIILESAKRHSLPDLHTAFKSVLGTSAGNHDLRLGSVMASAMLILKRWNDEEWAVTTYQPQNKFLTALFAAYRERSELVMFRTISTALSTVGDQWKGKPDHGIYVWLFELCLSPGSKRTPEFDQHTVLEHVDDHLLSLENRIREEGASEIVRQRGRDYQNRYVQAFARFCADQKYSSQQTWWLISMPMERYLKSVKELMENHPEHPENSKTMDLLLRLESAFTRPQWVGASASNSNREQTLVSSNFRRLLDQIGLSAPEKALVSTEENGLQVATGHDDGKRVGLPEIVYDMWGY
ncbi:hypothetical protein FRC00_005350 [Tulasnella sp. 408]|nr:hypothetical protein FRC00_005350 [Tulasnella sp. 408]